MAWKTVLYWAQRLWKPPRPQTRDPKREAVLVREFDRKNRYIKKAANKDWEKTCRLQMRGKLSDKK